MRVFKSKWFQRYSKAEAIGDSALLEAIGLADKGQMDADLGGEVIKQRIARPGQGKSKGYRVIIFFRRGERAFFMYGFAKSQRANLSRGEERKFKDAAKGVLALTDKQLDVLLKAGDFVEIRADE